MTAPPTASSNPAAQTSGLGMSSSIGMGMGMGGNTGINDQRTGAARLGQQHREWPLGYFVRLGDEMSGRVGVYRGRIAVSRA